MCHQQVWNKVYILISEKVTQKRGHLTVCPSNKFSTVVENKTMLQQEYILFTCNDSVLLKNKN